MKALILAAGRGRRLGSERPKCLHEVGGRPLLDRMLEELQPFVSEAVLVSGFEAGALKEAAEGFAKRPPLSFVFNEQFTRGSVLSLHVALQDLTRFGGEDLIVMDADVLFPKELLRRLVEDAPRDSFLLDPRSEASGEEMMLVAREGRVVRIARRVSPEPSDRIGEGVGFLKLGPEGQERLAEELQKLVDADELDRDYEDAIDAMLARHEVGFVEVDDLPWTEIDFEEDLARARDELLPRIEAL